RRSLHPGAAWAVESRNQPAGQPVRHDRDGDRHRHHARVAPSRRHRRLGARRRRDGDRRRHGGGDCAPPAAGFEAGTGVGGACAVTMTSMPELVAAFHSLVGMAAVLVAAGALYAPAAFDIGTVGAIHKSSLVEMSLGVAIGAVTFTGSVIAFLKLSGRMSGAP